MKKVDKKIDFDSVLFHGLTHYEVGNIRLKIGLQRLVNIIRAKAILSRKQLYNLYGDKHFRNWQKDFCRVNWNGVNNVSICEKKSSNSNKVSEAFRLFVENSISLILDKKLLDELPIYANNQLEDGEFQIQDKIDLKYVIGVAVPVLNPKEVAKHKKSKLYTREETESWIKGYYDYSINDVFKILNHYKLDLPVYSIRDGNVIKPLNEVLDEVYGKENELNL